jgi:hypothetical protein
MRARALIPHIATVIVSVTLSALVAMAWTGPSSSPPNGNADAPINIGATTQANGGSYLNFGATNVHRHNRAA